MSISTQITILNYVVHRVTEGQVSLGPQFWDSKLHVPEVLGLTIIGARGSWTFDNLLSPGPRLYLELKLKGEYVVMPV